MNKSRYNIVAAAPGGEHLLYNTANGSFAALGAQAFAGYENQANADEELLNDLIDAGFLTEATPEEELESLRGIFEAQRVDASELTLVLAPTYACNYRCPYCYELGHNAIKGIMDERVMEAVYRFVEERHAEQPLAKLTIEWYGGDPSLALDVVEQVSEHLIAWCDSHDVLYDAMILTNCNLIDERAADMLARSRVKLAFLTIDGLEATHNARRVAADGSNSFERNVRAAQLFTERGIHVMANMNADRVNIVEYRELRDYLKDQANVDLSFGRLCDYGHFYGTRGFEKPAFDLFDHDEFSRIKHEEFAAAGFDAATLASMLAPQDHFCGGQRDNYFVIDCRGDVYKCDGYIGEQDHVMFNIFDETPEECLRTIMFDPFEDEQCSQCQILPQCYGNCIWERRTTGMHCHPFKTTIEDYLRDWRSCYGELADSFTRLA